MNWKHSVSAIGLLFACVAGAVAQQPAGPPAGYEINTEYAFTSPDGASAVEEYAKISATGDYSWQFWVRRQGTLGLLDPKPSDYPAGFRFTNNSQWLVRMQKTGAGEQSLYLYRLAPQGFLAATRKPLGELAWDYFWSLPVSRKIRKPDFHISADLLKGVDDNYGWMGEKWPDSRYLVISLSGDVSPNNRHSQLRSVRGWHCRYDLQTGKFDAPADFAESNAKATDPKLE
jgi:hypothetical protein